LKNESKLAEIDTFGFEIPLELLNSADMVRNFCFDWIYFNFYCYY